MTSECNRKRPMQVLEWSLPAPKLSWHGLLTYYQCKSFRNCLNQPVPSSNEDLLSKLWALPLECNLEGAMQQRSALYHLWNWMQQAEAGLLLKTSVHNCKYMNQPRPKRPSNQSPLNKPDYSCIVLRSLFYVTLEVLQCKSGLCQLRNLIIRQEAALLKTSVQRQKCCMFIVQPTLSFWMPFPKTNSDIVN